MPGPGIENITTKAQLARFIEDRLPRNQGHQIQQVMEVLKFLAGRQIKAGTGVLTWPGGSAVSNSVNVPHGLGAIPTEMLVTANDTGGTGVVAIQTNGASSVNIVVVGEAAGGVAPSAAATTSFSWLAVA